MIRLGKNTLLKHTISRCTKYVDSSIMSGVKPIFSINKIKKNSNRKKNVLKSDEKK